MMGAKPRARREQAPHLRSPGDHGARAIGSFSDVVRSCCAQCHREPWAETRAFRFHRATHGFGELVRGPSFMPMTTVHERRSTSRGELTNETLEIALDSAERRYEPVTQQPA